MAKKKTLAGLCLIFAMILVGLVGRTTAQTSSAQLLLTWQADTYVPPGFSGKILPASDSSIIVGVDLIDLGKRVDLSTHKVSWYVDDRFYQEGVGLVRISLSAPHFIGENTIRVKALISTYGSGPGRMITIPVVPPEAVIQSSAPSLAASAAPFNIQAYPYFFNVKDLSRLTFEWKLNGQIAGNQNSFLATKEMAAGGGARLELSIKNPARPIERLTEQLVIF